MYITAKSLDDLLMHVFERLLKVKDRVHPSRGETAEITGVLLKLSNPRARLSFTETKGTLYSCLGEFLWYLSGDNNADHITYYLQRYESEAEGNKIWGGYGPRLLAMNGNDQVKNIIALLQQRCASRRAVIQLFDADDIVDELDETKRHKDVPCTCTVQLLVRRKKLHMFTAMRSNDAYRGLPHDIFAFTMLQELIARSLKIKLGSYKHFVGSLHLYKESIPKAKKFVNEGYQSTKSLMPPMPRGDPWTAMATVLQIETALRRRGKIEASALSELSPYWRDLVRLLQIYRHTIDEDGNEILLLKKQMHSKVYGPFIQRKHIAVLEKRR